MKRNDALFIFLIAISLALTGLIMSDNIISGTGESSRDLLPPVNAEELRAQLLGKGLTLHEGKYWRNVP